MIHQFTLIFLLASSIMFTINAKHMTLALGSEEGIQHYELEVKGTTLSTYWMSSCSWSVRIVMKLKGIS